MAAVRAGEITQAPKEHVDNPKWWTDSIVPILEDVRVYMLHWKGSRKKSKSCWTFVCEQLAGHDFVPPDAEEAFAQTNVDEFLLAAGYVMPAFARSSSGSKNSKVPAAHTSARLTCSKTEVAKRYAYNELDLLARKKLAESEWFWVYTPEACDDIFASYEVYARSNIFADIC